MELPEKIAAGVYDSRVVVKNTAVSKKRITSQFEIELPMEDGGISYIDDHTMPISTNRIICAKPGQTRHTKFPFRCYYLHMVIHSGALYDKLMHMPDFVDIPQSEPYRKIFNKLIRYYSAGSQENEWLLQSYVFKLVHQLCLDAEGSTERSEDIRSDPVIDTALSFIKTHLTEELSLQTVAQAVSLSPVYFHTLFKKAVGMTLRSYIEQQRIKKAIDLLLTTDYALTRIAYECGFSSQSYFSYAFKRKMGKTPRQYVQDIYSKYEI